MKSQQSIVGYFIDSDVSKFGDTFQFATSLISIFAVYVCSLIKRNRLTTISIRNILVQSRKETDTLEEALDNIINIHSDLYHCCRAIQDYFSIQMLSIVAVSFMTIVFNAFYILMMALGSSKLKTTVGKLEFIIFFTYQLIICLLGVIHIGRSTSRVIAENERIGPNTFNLIYNMKNEEIREKLRIFADNLLHMKVQFTASELFNLDKTLIITIIGTASTYLVILVQFLSSHNLSISDCVIIENTRILHAAKSMAARC
ncbi:putative gustatory receptor 28b [Phlebotomus argentipes]|uniref:putative gustatory receptor 28b n=1 Tax=Phlebotomus argentipes TaxID=94469 RepID=UPI002892A953|nr:putative gustatory receptor 28b [Phlebotomus argentipes]